MINEKELSEDVKNNLTCENLTKKYSCSKQTIINYLKKYKIKSPKGFYKKIGKKAGRPKGIPWTNEQKIKFSEKFKGEKNPFFGKKHSKKTRKKMKLNHADFKGNKNPFKKSLNDPKKLEEHKERCINIWQNRDEEYRNNFSSKLKRTAFGEITGQFWARVKANAKSRNLEFKIDIQYGWNLFLEQKRICVLSGLPLIFSKIETTASLDRIDSNIGYREGNLQWVHKTINLMKRNLSTNDFLQFCKKVIEHNEFI